MLVALMKVGVYAARNVASYLLWWIRMDLEFVRVVGEISERAVLFGGDGEIVEAGSSFVHSIVVAFNAFVGSISE